MSKRDAVSYLKALVRIETRHRARRLSKTCTRTSDHSFKCRARFRAGRRSYAGRFRVKHFQGSDGAVSFLARFRGRKSGGHRVRWSI